jgi:hypothetical protein
MGRAAGLVPAARPIGVEAPPPSVQAGRSRAMAQWKCAAEIWTERGSTFEFPISILKEAGAQTTEGTTLVVMYEATGSADEAAALMADVYRRCSVLIEWGAVSQDDFAWASWGEGGGSGGTDCSDLPADKNEAWERVNSETWNETITNALIGEEYSS